MELRRRMPERSCVGCRSKGPKEALVRLVRTADRQAALDPTGRGPGRGAYVHPDAECVRRAMAKGSLLRALRLPTDPRRAASLIEALRPAIRP